MGFMVVDSIAQGLRGQWKSNRDKTLLCKLELEGFDVILIKPQTFMNLSGKAVASIVNTANADPSGLIVIHDDLDLALGRVRLKRGGGDGGHKGIRSVADSLRFRDFLRVRLGVGRPPEGFSPEEFVLSAFAPEEEEARRALVESGVLAVKLLLTHGVEEAQNMIHATRKRPEGEACNA